LIGILFFLLRHIKAIAMHFLQVLFAIS